ncbi:MAG TPA: glucokinase [Thermodesulfobacteriota bacterium]|nr:glucokinase [Thermodesulfobacteriota bacterium]
MPGGKGKKSKPELILAGDVGGTNTRLGFFEATRGYPRPLSEKIYLSKNYKGLENILRDFLRGRREIAAACLGVAGPVTEEVIIATNLPWWIDIQSLQKALPIKKMEVINDLVANAYGISALKKRDFQVLNFGKIKKGNQALISAGTGLGEAILFWDGKQHLPSPSEGGHAEFGPRNRLEMELFNYLSERFDHVSYERVLSGEGLSHIYQFLKDSRKFGQEPPWLSEKMKGQDPAEVISETARLKKNGLCSKALDLFASIYGAAAGNLALQVMAVGGVFIGGGIAPKIIWKLKDGTFSNAFKDKGRLSRIVAHIPVSVIMNDKTALLGAASCAASLLKTS